MNTKPFKITAFVVISLLIEVFFLLFMAWTITVIWGLLMPPTEYVPDVFFWAGVIAIYNVITGKSNILAFKEDPKKTYAQRLGGALGAATASPLSMLFVAFLISLFL